MQRARDGGGPTLIEATCYRFRGHFEGDADSYRTEEEKERRRKEDPLELTAQRLISSGVASAEQVDSLKAAVAAAIADMLASVRADRSPDPATALRHVFAEVS